MKQVNSLDNKVISIMNRLRFFQSFTLEEKQAIVNKQGCIVLADADEEIIVQGRRDSSFYLVLTGELEVILKKLDENINLARIRPNDFVGEMSFLTGEPRSTSVFAKQESMLLKVDRMIMDSLDMSIREKIKDKIILKLVDRLKQANQKITTH